MLVTLQLPSSPFRTNSRQIDSRSLGFPLPSPLWRCRMNRSRLVSILRILGLWVPTVLLGALFVLQGIMKVQPGSPWPEMFEGWGYPAGFYWVVGAVELLGGLLLFVPRLAGYAAAALGPVMVGAILTHLAHGEIPGIIATFVFAAVLVMLARARLPRWRSRAHAAHSDPA